MDFELSMVFSSTVIDGIRLDQCSKLFGTDVVDSCSAECDVRLFRFQFK